MNRCACCSSLLCLPVAYLRILRFGEKAHLLHESLARLAVDDELVVGLAGVFALAAPAIGQQPLSRRRGACMMRQKMPKFASSTCTSLSSDGLA